MRVEQIVKHIVPIEDIGRIENRLKNLNAQLLMYEKLMFRTLFQVGNKQEKNWVRVRMGDISHDGRDVIAITYKQIIYLSGEKRENVIDVEVEDYDESVELLDRIGLKRLSKQETKRTKYFVEYNEEKYTVCIDEWPWLDRLRFVRIQPISGVDKNALEDLSDLLHIKNHPSYRGGVDEVYIKELGVAISDFEDVRFGITYPIDKKST